MIICLIISAIFIVLGILSFCQKMPLLNLYYIIQVQEKKAKMDKKLLYNDMGFGYIMFAIAFVLYVVNNIFDIHFIWHLATSLIVTSFLYFFMGVSYKMSEKYKSKKK